LGEKMALILYHDQSWEFLIMKDVMYMIQILTNLGRLDVKEIEQKIGGRRIDVLLSQSEGHGRQKYW